MITVSLFLQWYESKVQLPELISVAQKTLAVSPFVFVAGFPKFAIAWICSSNTGRCADNSKAGVSKTFALGYNGLGVKACTACTTAELAGAGSK